MGLARLRAVFSLSFPASAARRDPPQAETGGGLQAFWGKGRGSEDPPWTPNSSHPPAPHFIGMPAMGTPLPPAGCDRELTDVSLRFGSGYSLWELGGSSDLSLKP